MKTIRTLITIFSIALGSLQAAAPKGKNAPKKTSDPTPSQLLAKFDENKDGGLDKTELSKALKSLKSNSVSTKQGIDKWDTNKDGKLDLKELTALLKENK